MPRNAYPALNSIGYVVNHTIQFDNAVYFGSSVMIWRGNRLVSSQAILTSHDEDTVTLSNGMILRKDEHYFVVRSCAAMRDSLIKDVPSDHREVGGDVLCKWKSVSPVI